MPTTVRQLIETFRKEVDDPYVPGGQVADPDADSLWKDSEIFGYIDEAQIELSRRTLMFNESKQLSFQANDEFLDHPKGYIEHRFAYAIDGTNRHPMLFRSVEEMEQAITDDYGLRTTTDWITEAGWPPRFLVGDYVHGKFKMVPKPDKAGSILLLYYSHPVLNPVGMSQQLSFDQPHHTRALLHWMKALAYAKQDAETLDLQRSQQFEVAFERAARGIDSDEKRGRRKPGTVAYGGL